MPNNYYQIGIYTFSNTIQMDLQLKKGQYSKALIYLCGAIDIFCMYISSSLILQNQVWETADVAATTKTVIMIFILTWLASSILLNAYFINSINSLKNILISMVKCFCYSTLTAIFILKSIHMEWHWIQHTVQVWLFFMVLAVSVRFLLLLLYQLIRNTKQNQIRYIIIGYSSSGRKLLKHIEKERKPGYIFLGFFDDYHEDPNIQGCIEDIPDYCVRNNVNQIFYTLPDDSKLIEDVIRFSDNNFIHFGLVQEYEDVQFKTAHHLLNNNIPIITVNPVS